MGHIWSMQTVAETRQYMLMAEKHLSPAKRQEVVDAVAADPEIGDILAGTGGIRKFRLAKDGGGKSGGVRVIYYYYDTRMPIVLITLFAKNEKGNLSKKERSDLSQWVAALKHSIRRNYD